MGDTILCKANVTEINEQNMKFKVINHHPQYSNKSNENEKRQVEDQLFKVFKKYVNTYETI